MQLLNIAMSKFVVICDEFFANFNKNLAKEKEFWYYMEGNNIATNVAIKF